MIEVRFHGRGGQGAVTSTDLMAQAIIEEGRYAQAFPLFGPERRGAPVLAFMRAGEEPIRIRSKVYHPDVVVVLDPTLLPIVEVTSGLKPEGLLIINTHKTVEEVRNILGYSGRLALVDASRIAMEEMKVPITNTTMLGALIRATGLAQMASMDRPLEKRFGKIAERNKRAMQRAYGETVIEE
jgi:pyruvate ferredoxin oxidoreductase gamma subunit